MWKYKEEKNIDAMFDFEVKETELPIYVKWTRYCLHWYIRKAVQNNSTRGNAIKPVVRSFVR